MIHLACKPLCYAFLMVVGDGSSGDGDSRNEHELKTQRREEGLRRRREERERETRESRGEETRRDERRTERRMVWR